jgi:hypothetical protein
VSSRPLERPAAVDPIGLAASLILPLTRVTAGEGWTRWVWSVPSPSKHKTRPWRSLSDSADTAVDDRGRPAPPELGGREGADPQRVTLWALPPAPGRNSARFVTALRASLAAVEVPVPLEAAGPATPPESSGPVDGSGEHTPPRAATRRRSRSRGSSPGGPGQTRRSATDRHVPPGVIPARSGDPLAEQLGRIDERLVRIEAALSERR